MNYVSGYNETLQGNTKCILAELERLWPEKIIEEALEEGKTMLTIEMLDNKNGKITLT